MIDERRRAALTLAGLSLALALLCGWLLYDSVATLRTAMRTAAPAIRVDTGDAAMAILLPIIAGIGLLGVLAFFRRTQAAAMPTRIVIMAALVALPLSVAAPWLFRGWAEQQLLARGYVRCESRGRPTRFATLAFARTPSLCATRPD